VGPELIINTCVYDMPPDRDFILAGCPAIRASSIGSGAGHAANSAA